MSCNSAASASGNDTSGPSSSSTRSVWPHRSPVGAAGVLLGGGEHDGVGVAAVAVGDVGAEGGDLDFERAGGRARAEHLDDAEAGADGDGAAEQRLDLLGPGVGGDVVVVRLAAEELVADAAAGPQRLEAFGAEAADDVGGELALGHARDCPAAGGRWQPAVLV